MNIAITGTGGLIGGEVYERLAREHTVLRVGRRSDCDAYLDLTDLASIRAVDLGDCDALVHCAGVVDGDFQVDGELAFRHATVGTKLLVERAVAAGIRLLVYFSTSHIYGPPRGVQDESAPPAPQSDYAIAHYASERFFTRAAERAAVMILRPNAVFGVPRSLETFDRWSLIPFSFPAEAVYRGQITLKSSGEQYRNFISTVDLADDVAQFLGSGPDHGCLVRNPLGGSSLTVRAFADRCAEVVSRLTGQPCVVHCEAPDRREVGLDFTYLSQFDSGVGRQTVDEYLVTLSRRLLEDLNRGRVYGT